MLFFELSPKSSVLMSPVIKFHIAEYSVQQATAFLCRLRCVENNIIEGAHAPEKSAQTR